MTFYSVLDIGGTFVKSAVMDHTGKIISEKRTPTPAQGKGDIYQLIREIVKEDQSTHDISGLALSIPAAVNVETGYVSYTGSITDFVGEKVKDVLADLNLPIELENDANCAALAEKWKGNATDTDLFLCVTIGTGIGGAIHLKDGIMHGTEGMAGEFGLMLLSHDEQMDALFETETFSRVGSTWNMVAKLNQHFNENLTGEEWFERYDQGNEEVGQIIKRFYYQISLGIINLMHLFAPEKILVGGGISVREDLIKFIQEQITHVPTPIAEHVQVDACKLGNQAGLVGALYHFLTRQEIL